MRYIRTDAPAHAVTIPDHRSLRLGTLRGVVGQVAAKLNMSVDALAEILFS